MKIRGLLTCCSLSFAIGISPYWAAQNPDMQQKVAEAKEAMARNKQLLAQYTWVEQVTISLKGE